MMPKIKELSNNKIVKTNPNASSTLKNRDCQKNRDQTKNNPQEITLNLIFFILFFKPHPAYGTPLLSGEGPGVRSS